MINNPKYDELIFLKNIFINSEAPKNLENFSVIEES